MLCSKSGVKIYPTLGLQGLNHWLFSCPLLACHVHIVSICLSRYDKRPYGCLRVSRYIIAAVSLHWVICSAHPRSFKFFHPISCICFLFSPSVSLIQCRVFLTARRYQYPLLVVLAVHSRLALLHPLQVLKREKQPNCILVCPISLSFVFHLSRLSSSYWLQFFHFHSRNIH